MWRDITEIGKAVNKARRTNVEDGKDTQDEKDCKDTKDRKDEKDGKETDQSGGFALCPSR
jgi:hypothetical protein